MTREQVVKLLRKQQGKQSLRAFAAILDVTPAYLSDIYRNRRDPGPKILNLLEIDKQTTTEYVLRERAKIGRGK